MNRSNSSGKCSTIGGPTTHGASPGSRLSQDARVLVARVTPAAELKHSFHLGRGGYLYVIDGEATLGEAALAAGDAAKVKGPEDIALAAPGATELILVDVPLEFRPVGVWASRR